MCANYVPEIKFSYFNDLNFILINEFRSVLNGLKKNLLPSFFLLFEGSLMFCKERKGMKNMDPSSYDKDSASKPFLLDLKNLCSEYTIRPHFPCFAYSNFFL